MRYVPILFSSEMVKAILEGRKTQTRRFIKPQPDFDSAWRNWGQTENPPRIDVRGDLLGVEDNDLKRDFYGTACCVPNIKIKAHKGDIFWVRETWGVGTRPHPSFGWIDGFEYKADELFLMDDIEDLPIHPNEDIDFSEYDNGKEGWKPSIFMPKEACRIFLEVTDVRVERLKDISEEDAKAEGVKSAECESMEGCIGCKRRDNCLAKDTWWDYMNPSGECGWPCGTAKESFFTLWESINGSESLESNPWVWVYDFKQVEKPKDFKPSKT